VRHDLVLDAGLRRQVLGVSLRAFEIERSQVRRALWCTTAL
jgi:hypothetical protein